MVAPAVLGPVHHTLAAVFALVLLPMLPRAIQAFGGPHRLHACMVAVAVVGVATLAWPVETGLLSTPLVLLFSVAAHVALRLTALPHGLILAAAATQSGADGRAAMAADKLLGSVTRTAASGLIAALPRVPALQVALCVGVVATVALWRAPRRKP